MLYLSKLLEVSSVFKIEKQQIIYNFFNRILQNSKDPVKGGNFNYCTVFYLFKTHMQTLQTFKNFYIFIGVKGDWDFQISDLVKKTLMELRFNPCGEFR